MGFSLRNGNVSVMTSVRSFGDPFVYGAFEEVHLKVLRTVDIAIVLKYHPLIGH